MTTPEKFIGGLRKFVVKTRARQDAVVVVLTEFVFSTASVTTPVWSGRAQASWRAAQGRIDKSTEPETGVPLSYAISSTPPGAVRGFKGGPAVWVTLNVPYAFQLEHAIPRVYGTYRKGSHMMAQAAGRAQGAWPTLVRKARERTR